MLTRGSRCLSCAQNNFLILSLVARAMSFDPHSTPSFVVLHSTFIPPHLLFLAHVQRRFNREPSPIHTASEVTVLRNSNLAQVMSPRRLATRRLSTSLTRSSLNKRVLTLPKIPSTTQLKRVRFQKLMISSLPYNQSVLSSSQDSMESLATPQEADWTTNKFLLCWLHHGTWGSEKQLRNDHKFITLKEKVGCQVHLKV